MATRVPFQTMLTPAELKRVINAGSGQRVEVVTAGATSPARLARGLASLANAEGGLVVVGIPETTGRSKSANAGVEQLMSVALQSTQLTEPRLIVPLPYWVTAASGEEPLALVLEVPPGLPNVYSLDGRYLTRRDGRTVPLATRAIRELLLTRGEGAWEAMSPPGSTLADLNMKRAEDYAAVARALDDATTEDVLLRRGCLVQQAGKMRPTMAGLLLFGVQPQRWIKGSDLVCARFKGNEMSSAFASQPISGTLPDQIRKAENFLSENSPQQSSLAKKADWQRTDEGPYPPGVLREAVVNAIAHRDYHISGAQVNVLMFGNRVEVRSPGRLPGHVTLKNLIRERYSRNEAIVQVLADMGFIERLGYGIDRMVRAMKDSGHEPPQFEETDNGFLVTLFAHDPMPLAITGRDVSPQSLRFESMIAHLREKGRITNRDYAELCPDVSAESLRRDFVELAERGLILRVGDKRGTYYILK